MRALWELSRSSQGALRELVPVAGIGAGFTSSEELDVSVEGSWFNKPLHPREEGSTTGLSWEEISGGGCCIWPDPTHQVWLYPSHSRLKIGPAFPVHSLVEVVGGDAVVIAIGPHDLSWGSCRLAKFCLVFIEPARFNGRAFGSGDVLGVTINV